MLPDRLARVASNVVVSAYPEKDKVSASLKGRASEPAPTGLVMQVRVPSRRQTGGIRHVPGNVHQVCIVHLRSGRVAIVKRFLFDEAHQDCHAREVVRALVRIMQVMLLTELRPSSRQAAATSGSSSSSRRDIFAAATFEAYTLQVYAFTRDQCLDQLY